MTAFAPRIVNSNDPQLTVWNFVGGQNHIRNLLGSKQTAGRFAFFESVLAPGFVVRAHIHRDEDEYWYMLDSGIEILLGEEQLTVQPSSIVAIPAGVLHELRNAGDEPARSLFFTMPGGLEKFFAEMQALGPEAAPENFRELSERTGHLFPGGART